MSERITRLSVYEENVRVKYDYEESQASPVRLMHRQMIESPDPIKALAGAIAQCRHNNDTKGRYCGRPCGDLYL